MIKAKQKNIRIFEFSGGTSEQYIEFINKNFVLLRGYLLVFKEQISQNLIDFLISMKIDYLISLNQLNSRDISLNTPLVSVSSDIEIFNRNIRSGEEIENNNDVVLLGNLNNGAKISSNGNVSIFGKCDGIVECNGEYILLKAVASGHIIFKEQILPQEVVEKVNSNDLLKIITKNGDTIVIKEIK